MNQILFVNSCIRPASRTYELALSVLGKLHGQVEELKLDEEAIKPLFWEQLEKRDACIEKREFQDSMFQHAKQFASANTIVIAAPYWDFSFPSVLKIYMEAITVRGITFQYNIRGETEGLCQAKKLIYVTTAGGEIGDFNFGFEYIKTLAIQYFQIPEVLCCKAEMLDVKGADVPAIMERGKKEITKLLSK